MTKKAIHIILSILLLISTTGITISKHYSGGNLFSIAFWADAEKCCEIPCDCCSDEVSFFYLDTDYLQTSTTEVQKTQIEKITLSDIFFFVSLFTETNNTSIQRYVWDTSPTYTSNPPAYLQVFRC